MKTAIITGAAKGIGRAIALKLMQNGYFIIINYLHSEKEAAALLALIEEQGSKAMLCCADVRDEAMVMQMIEKTLAKTGRIDVLVNNAGIACHSLLQDMSVSEWEEIFAVNMRGVFNCTKAVLPQMISQKNGVIINISSMWGITGASCEVAYSASKAGVIGFTKALAKEVAPSNIRVNCLAPGVIDTAMNAALSAKTLSELAEETPLNRLGTTLDVANAAAFLAGDDASFITGQVLNVDGGFII